jgi:CBS domain-containing protein
MAEMVRRQDAAILPASASVQHACRIMRDRHVGAMLVVDGNGRLTGLFTGRARSAGSSRRRAMTTKPHWRK